MGHGGPTSGPRSTLASVSPTAAKTNPSPEQRRALHAYLSDDAHETWHAVAAELGVSVSALLEAMAIDLRRPASEQAMATRVDDVVRRARRIDADRRRR